MKKIKKEVIIGNMGLFTTSIVKVSLGPLFMTVLLIDGEVNIIKKLTLTFNY